jgi:hypothetical protein
MSNDHRRVEVGTITNPLKRTADRVPEEAPCSFLMWFCLKNWVPPSCIIYIWYIYILFIYVYQYVPHIYWAYNLYVYIIYIYMYLVQKDPVVSSMFFIKSKHLIFHEWGPNLFFWDLNIEFWTQFGNACPGYLCEDWHDSNACQMMWQSVLRSFRGVRQDQPLCISL